MRNNKLEQTMLFERTAQVLGTLALLAIFMGQASAAPCVAPPATPEAIAQFKANPQALVAPNSDTRTIEASVRDLAGTDASLAADLVHVAEGAPPRVQTAIAAGLAQAAIACTNVDQNAGLTIQQAVANFPDGQFQSAFEAVAGDLSTAATSAAASSAASSVGSVVIVNPNRGGRSTTNPGGGGNTALVQITSSAIAVNRANNGPTSPSTTAANPVSPTR
jgi:hypothetical protein